MWVKKDCNSITRATMYWPQTVNMRYCIHYLIWLINMHCRGLFSAPCFSHGAAAEWTRTSALHKMHTSNVRLLSTAKRTKSVCVHSAYVHAEACVSFNSCYAYTLCSLTMGCKSSSVSQKHHSRGTSVMFVLANVTSHYAVHVCKCDNICSGHIYTWTGCQIWGSYWEWARKQQEMQL